jgi:hypothetical protein
MNIADMMTQALSGARKSTGQKYSTEEPAKNFTIALDDAAKIDMKNEKKATWKQINNKSKAFATEAASFSDAFVKLQKWMGSEWRANATSSKSQETGRQEAADLESFPPPNIPKSSIRKSGGIFNLRFSTSNVQLLISKLRFSKAPDLRIQDLGIFGGVGGWR